MIFIILLLFAFVVICFLILINMQFAQTQKNLISEDDYKTQLREEQEQKIQEYLEETIKFNLNDNKKGSSLQ